ncbi:MAG: hypothetical protein M1457_05140 [bacterium]|nr:hypothetical protein [bacterium]
MKENPKAAGVESVSEKFAGFLHNLVRLADPDFEVGRTQWIFRCEGCGPGVDVMIPGSLVQLAGRRRWVIKGASPGLAPHRAFFNPTKSSKLLNRNRFF